VLTPYCTGSFLHWYCSSFHSCNFTTDTLLLCICSVLIFYCTNTVLYGYNTHYICSVRIPYALLLFSTDTICTGTVLYGYYMHWYCSVRILYALVLFSSGTLLHWLCSAQVLYCNVAVSWPGIIILHSLETIVSEERNFSFFSVKLNRVNYSLPLLCSVDKVTNEYLEFLKSTKSRNFLYPLTLSWISLFI